MKIVANTVVVTGGAGFIGSALVRHLIQHTDMRVVNLDKLTYAGDLRSLETVSANERYQFVQLDICDGEALREVFARYRPDAVMHLAAETHVDRSIDGPAGFIETNILGTYTLLESTRRYWRELEPSMQGAFRFLHVSTDEVFGSLGPEGAFHETTRYDPRSPYSASKASADHLVRAWFHTYGVPVLITNCSNNYGPFQNPEKLVPTVILRAVAGRPIPVYGQGSNVRDWLYVDDHVRGLLAVLARGAPGESYNIGTSNEQTSLNMARHICWILDELRPLDEPYASLIEFVEDRPGHDFRYAIDASKVRRALGWQPRESFETGLSKTVSWYLENLAWCEQVLGGALTLERQGLPDPR